MVPTESAPVLSVRAFEAWTEVSITGVVLGIAVTTDALARRRRQQAGRR